MHMNKLILSVTIVALLFSCNNSQMKRKERTLKPYPETKKSDISDNYHGTNVPDPYRWLEYDTAADVAQWVKAENEVTHNYLEQIPFRNKIKKRLTEIWDCPKYSSPFKEGDYYFFFKNDGLQTQSVLYYQKGLDATPEV